MGFKDFSNRVDKWDQKIIIKYNGKGGKFLTYILKFASFFGRETLWIFLIAFFLFIWYDPFLISNLGAIFLIGLVIIVTLKRVVNRTRPFDRLDNDKIIVLEKKPSSKSFPSWHSYNIVAYGLLIGFFLLKSPLLTGLMLILAVIVSFSRIQLGVHYPSDVIFGFFIGILGFSVSVTIVAPVFQMIIEYLELFTLHDIEYRQINSFLFENFWYIVLWIIICITIFLSAIYKHIQDKFIGRKMKS
ncbi:MAG: phosphatase PAP2 family protein [Candidatus Hermodarchaeota archaeon]